MKKITILFYAIWMAANMLAEPISTQNRNDLAHMTKSAADSLYMKENYKDAIKAYDYIIDNKGISPELYYNLGNCYYRTDSFALAILNYERALKLDPSDADIRTNLSLARTKIKDKNPDNSGFFLVAWWKTFSNWLNINLWKAIGLICFILCLSLWFIHHYQIIQSHRSIVKMFLYASLFIFILCNLASYQQYRTSTNDNSAIVMKESSILKSSPTENSNDLYVLHAGSRIKILDKSMEKWCEVKFGDDKEGWINKDDIEII